MKEGEESKQGGDKQMVEHEMAGYKKELVTKLEKMKIRFTRTTLKIRGR